MSETNMGHCNCVMHLTFHINSTFNYTIKSLVFLFCNYDTYLLLFSGKVAKNVRKRSLFRIWLTSFLRQNMPTYIGIYVLQSHIHFFCDQSIIHQNSLTTEVLDRQLSLNSHLKEGAMISNRKITLLFEAHKRRWSVRLSGWLMASLVWRLKISPWRSKMVAMKQFCWLKLFPYTVQAWLVPALE